MLQIRRAGMARRRRAARPRSPSPAAAGKAQPPQAPPRRRFGFFPSDSPLDHWDRAVSRPFFFFEAWHPHLDRVLLIPGTWMGLPASTWGFASAAMVWYYHHVHDLMTNHSLWFLAGLVVGPMLAYTAVFVRGMVQGKPTLIYNPKMQLPIPLALWTAIWAVADTHRGPGAFFAVSWSLAQAVTHLVKITAGRMRPIRSFDLSKVKREFKELRYMFSEGHTVLESFPSADSAGAGALAGTLVLMGVSWAWIVLLSVTAMFSRLYFHAHHVLDVVAGYVIGLGSVAVVYGACGHRLDVLGPGHVVASAVAFVVVHLGSKRLKPHLPEEWKSRDTNRFKHF